MKKQISLKDLKKAKKVYDLALKKIEKTLGAKYYNLKYLYEKENGCQHSEIKEIYDNYSRLYITKCYICGKHLGSKY